jgi:ABC-type glycerol-3-phosphate transport system substrate-binding protein
LALIGGSGLLAGCAAWRERAPVVLYLAISTLGNEGVSRDTTEQFALGYRETLQRFQQIHPNVQVQLAVYQENMLGFALGRRQRSGLGPDLIATTAEQAHALMQQGLLEPVPLGPRHRQAIEPALLRRVTDRQGRIFAQPLLVLAQLACYDTRRLSQAPTTVRELLSASAAGARVGLSLQVRELFWSAGSLGALPAIRTAVQGGQPDPRQMEGLRAWLRWLQAAESQNRLSFLDNEIQLRDGLRRGQLDWITCRSSDLQALQRSMGRHLGVAALPNGDGFEASPVSVLRVLTLGRGSTPRQRQLAIQLAHFSLNPLMQRSLTLLNRSVLPVNPQVRVPVNASHVLAALEMASRQAEQAGPVLAVLHTADPRIPRLREVLVQGVFAELSPDQAAQQLVAILRSPP